jgi:hypothetical protein
MFAEPSLVSRRETWRPYVPHFFATRRTVIEGRLRYTHISSPGIARHGMAFSEWADLGMHGETSAFVSQCTVVVMAKDDGVFSYVNRACGCGEASLQKSCHVLRHVSNVLRVVINLPSISLPLLCVRMYT